MLNRYLATVVLVELIVSTPTYAEDKAACDAQTALAGMLGGYAAGEILNIDTQEEQIGLSLGSGIGVLGGESIGRKVDKIFCSPSESMLEAVNDNYGIMEVAA